MNERKSLANEREVKRERERERERERWRRSFSRLKMLKLARTVSHCISIRQSISPDDFAIDTNYSTS